MPIPSVHSRLLDRFHRGSPLRSNYSNDLFVSLRFQTHHHHPCARLDILMVAAIMEDPVEQTVVNSVFFFYHPAVFLYILYGGTPPTSILND